MEPIQRHFLDCCVDCDNRRLLVGNSKITREWDIGANRLRTVRVASPNAVAEGRRDGGSRYDFRYDGLTGKTSNGLWEDAPLRLIEVAASVRRKPRIGPPRLSTRLLFQDPRQGLEIGWWARIMPGIEAVSVQCEIRSENAPLGDYNRAGFANFLDTLPLPERVVEFKSVLLFARSDRREELIRTATLTPREFQAQGATGSILFVLADDGSGFFVLHDGPCREDRRNETLVDFGVRESGVAVFGWGIRPEEISPSEFLRSYTVTTGNFTGGYDGGERAVKRFLQRRYPSIGTGRPVVVANPWGDLKWHENASAESVKEQVQACAEIGLTDFALDDGWQAGGVLADLSSNGIITDRYWEPHPGRFPGGLAPLRTEGDRRGVKLALWYALDSNRHYRTYQEDARRLLDLCAQGGFERIKIDMIRTRTKSAEDNLFRILAAVRREYPEVTFEVDITGPVQRPGYFLPQDYGDIFVENRYTACGNYYPWKTAQVFWNLARFLRIQRLEMEFLNPRLNQGKYEKNDPLSPSRYDIGYLFGMTFFAVPLCWCEPSGLVAADRRRLKELVGLRRALHERIQCSLVEPVGEEPDGRSWFGFLALEDDGRHALLSVFRDRLAPESADLAMPVFGSKGIGLRRLAGDVQISGRDEGVAAAAPSPGDFGLFELKLL